MHHEILRIQNVSVKDTNIEKLENIHILFMGGTCTSLQGLVQSGKNLLIKLILGEKIRYTGRICVQGQEVKNLKMKKDMIYHIRSNNYQITDWTIAEYIALVDKNGWYGMYDVKKTTKLVQEILDKFEIPLTADTKIEHLSAVEKRLMDLIKAYFRNAVIVVIEDEFEGCAYEDIVRFRVLMHQIMTRDNIFILNSNSNLVSSIIPDNYVVFKSGNVVKKCKKSAVERIEELEKYQLGSTISSSKAGMDSYEKVNSEVEGVVYAVENMRLQTGEVLKFEFIKGNIYTILALNIKKKEEIFNLLSGREIQKNMKIHLDSEVCNFRSIDHFVKNKIVAIQKMGAVDELLSDMSLGENLLIPSLVKLSSLEYIFFQKKIRKVLEDEVGINLSRDDSIKCMKTNEYIKVLLNRWYIFNPRVFILLEPFAYCDVYGVSLVQSYLKKIVDMGAVVIVIKSREEYMEGISNRIINIDE